MAKRNPALWTTEPVENFNSHHRFFRGISHVIWEYWDDINYIEENFITFFRKPEKEHELSVDWDKYCQDPRDTLMRLFLTSYSRKNKISINSAIQNLGISYSTSPFGLTIEDLLIPHNIVFNARKKYGILRFIIGELMKVIEEQNFPMELKHKPIKSTNQKNYFLNRAHSIIDFTKVNYTKVRALLREKVEWCNGYKPIIG